MEYEITMSGDSDGLMHCNSPEAQKYLTPVIGPLGMSLVRVMADLATRGEEVFTASAAELAARSGGAQERIAKAMERLSRHRMIDLEAVEEGSMLVSLNQWVDPPRVGARVNNFTPDLLDEFNEMVVDAEARLVASPEASSTPIAIRSSIEPESDTSLSL